MLPSKMSGVACPKFEFWCSGHSFGSVFKKPPSAKLLLFGLLLGILCIDETEKIRFQMVTGCIYGNHQAAQWVHFHQQLAMKPGTWKWKWESQWLQMRSKKWHQFHDSPVLISKCIPNTFPRQSTEMDAAAAATKTSCEFDIPPSSGLLSLASLALYSRTLSSCHDLPQWPLSSCSIGKGRAACRRGKEGSMEWWSHRRKRWKMRGYPQNASTLTPCRHNESLGNGTRKIGMAALWKRWTPEFKSFTCISLRLLVT